MSDLIAGLKKDPIVGVFFGLLLLMITVPAAMLTLLMLHTSDVEMASVTRRCSGVTNQVWSSIAWGDQHTAQAICERHIHPRLEEYPCTYDGAPRFCRLDTDHYTTVTTVDDGTPEHVLSPEDREALGPQLQIILPRSMASL